MLSVREVALAAPTDIARSEPKLVRAAQEFEAQMMKELMRPLTRPEDEDHDTGSGGALADFAGEILGQSLSRAGGFGIADRILASLSQTGTQVCESPEIGKSQVSDPIGLRLLDGQSMNSSRRIAYGDSEQR